MLASSGFLDFHEGDGPLGHCALASPLSYFLWSALPDPELLVANSRAPGAIATEALRILSDPESAAFARNLPEKLLTYSTGRLVAPSDEPAVDAIVRALDRKGGGLRDLVLLIVESVAFKRN